MSTAWQSPHYQPSCAEIDRLTSDLSITAVGTPPGKPLNDMLAWLRNERAKGGAELVGFHYEGSSLFDYLVTNRRLHENSTIETLLTHPSIRDALPHFGITAPLTYSVSTRSPRGWTPLVPLQIPGEWATYLDSGGIYTQPNQLEPHDRGERSRQAFDTAWSTYRALIGHRFQPAITAYRTSDPWCSWFPSVFNGTWLTCDHEHRTLWLFAFTDVD